MSSQDLRCLDSLNMCQKLYLLRSPSKREYLPGSHHPSEPEIVEFTSHHNSTNTHCFSIIHRSHTPKPTGKSHFPLETHSFQRDSTLFFHIRISWILPLVQFTLAPQLCQTHCDPVDCSLPGFPVHRQPLELAQTHVYPVSDAIQPSHPLSSPSPPAFNLSQHRSLFKWVGSLYQVAKVLEFQLQHQSFQWIFRTDFL